MYDMTPLKNGWRRVARLLRGNGAPPPVLRPEQGYDRWAATYEANRTPVQVLEAQALERVLPDLENRTVLDLGCGRGRITRLALQRGARNTVGVDCSEAMLEAAAASIASPRAAWVQASVPDVPLKTGTVDVVIAALVMGHVPNLDAALAEVNRVLTSRGMVLITDFHPFATARGWQRTFEDARNGCTYAIEQHLHLFADYIRCFQRLDIELEALEELCHDGFPLVFALRARKLT